MRAERERERQRERDGMEGWREPNSLLSLSLSLSSTLLAQGM